MRTWTLKAWQTINHGTHWEARWSTPAERVEGGNELRFDEVPPIRVVELEPVLDLLERWKRLGDPPDEARWEAEVDALLRSHGRLSSVSALGETEPGSG